MVFIMESENYRLLTSTAIVPRPRPFPLRIRHDISDMYHRLYSYANSLFRNSQAERRMVYSSKKAQTTTGNQNIPESLIQKIGYI